MRVDFGPLALGTTLTRPVPIPLQMAISSLPGDLVLYAGGSSTIDLVLGGLGLRVPMTAGVLAQRFPGLQARYSIRSVISSGLNAAEFSALPGDCIGNIGTQCTASVSFSPVALGERQTKVFPSADSITLAGGGMVTELANAIVGWFSAPVSSQLAFAVFGTGKTPVTVAPESLGLPDTECGQKSGALAIELISMSSVPILVRAVEIVGPDALAFVLSANASAGQSVAPGGRLKVAVAFAPKRRGPAVATVRILHSAPLSPITVSLAGKGLAPLPVMTPPSLDFGEVAAGAACMEKIVTLRNDGDAPLRVSALSIGGAGASSFVLADNTCIGAPVLPGSVAQIAVSFAPATMGYRQAALAVTSNAIGPGAALSLTGSGMPAARLHVGLQADQWLAAAGAALKYAVTARNHGPHTATGVRIVMQLPARASFVAASAPCLAPPTGATGGLFWNVGTLKVGAAATLEVTVKTTAATGTEVRAQASIRAATPDPSGEWSFCEIVTAVR